MAESYSFFLTWMQLTGQPSSASLLVPGSLTSISSRMPSGVFLRGAFLMSLLPSACISQCSGLTAAHTPHPMHFQRSWMTLKGIKRRTVSDL